MCAHVRQARARVCTRTCARAHASTQASARARARICACVHTQAPTLGTLTRALAHAWQDTEERVKCQGSTADPDDIVTCMPWLAAAQRLKTRVPASPKLDYPPDFLGSMCRV